MMMMMMMISGTNTIMVVERMGNQPVVRQDVRKKEQRTVGVTRPAVLPSGSVTTTMLMMSVSSRRRVPPVAPSTQLACVTSRTAGSTTTKPRRRTRPSRRNAALVLSRPATKCTAFFTTPLPTTDGRNGAGVAVTDLVLLTLSVLLCITALSLHFLLVAHFPR